MFGILHWGFGFFYLARTTNIWVLGSQGTLLNIAKLRNILDDSGQNNRKDGTKPHN